MARAKPSPYRCLMPVRHDGHRYAAGDPISLPDTSAAALLAVPAIERTEVTKPPPDPAGPPT